MDKAFNKVQYDNEYVKQNYKRISLNIDQNYFNNKIISHCKRSGIPVNTFIKQCIYKVLGDPE